MLCLLCSRWCVFHQMCKYLFIIIKITYVVIYIVPYSSKLWPFQVHVHQIEFWHFVLKIYLNKIATKCMFSFLEINV